jgi:hypothetical protein
MFAGLEKKVEALKGQAVERGFMTQDWQLPFKVEEEIKPPEPPAVPETSVNLEPLPQTEPEPLQTPEKSVDETPSPIKAEPPEELEAKTETPIDHALRIQREGWTTETKKAETAPKAAQVPVPSALETEVAESKPKRVHRTRKTQTKEKLRKQKGKAE